MSLPILRTICLLGEKEKKKEEENEKKKANERKAVIPQDDLSGEIIPLLASNQYKEKLQKLMQEAEKLYEKHDEEEKKFSDKLAHLMSQD